MNQTRIPHLFVFALVLALSALACNMPVRNASPEQTAPELEAQLSENSNIQLRSVNSAGRQVTIDINLAAGQTENGLYSTWVYLFDTALRGVPNAQSIAIQMYLLDKPYARLTASAEDIKALQDGQINLQTFFGRLQLDDQRPPEAGLRQALTSRGWVVTGVTIDLQLVSIDAFQPQAETQSEIVVEWFQAMMLACEYAPESQQVSLHLLQAAPSDLTILASQEHIRAFQQGEIDAGAFLGGLSLDQ